MREEIYSNEFGNLFHRPFGSQAFFENTKFLKCPFKKRLYEIVQPLSQRKYPQSTAKEFYWDFIRISNNTERLEIMQAMRNTTRSNFEKQPRFEVTCA